MIIKKFIFSSYSKSIFYLNKISDHGKVMLVDIGFEKTTAFLFENKQIQQFNILPIGGNHISKDISKILKIEISKANEIKLNFNNINNDKDLKQDEIADDKKDDGFTCSVCFLVLRNTQLAKPRSKVCADCA